MSAYIGRLSLTHSNAGDLALHRAIAQNDLDAVRRLLDNDATLVCAGGATPLVVAIQHCRRRAKPETYH